MVALAGSLLIGPTTEEALGSPKTMPSYLTNPPMGGALSLREFKQKPKLIVVIVIDQFRADYLTRFAKRFLPAKIKNDEVGGFQYLMETGSYFVNAQYDILQCMTGPGHATILSGSYPYAMGISLNEWYDSKLGRNVYCVDDPTQAIVGPAETDEIGMSPVHFESTTVGDELKNAGHSSKVVSIAIKDRAAILLGGHRADLAIWFSKKFQWVSSRYYIKSGELPSWVQDLNSKLQQKNKSEFIWQSTGQESGLSIPVPGGHFEKHIQHGTQASIPSPIGIDLTTDAALAAVQALKLGHGTAPDLLTLSYSSHDYAGHAHGPNAREMEEMTIAEDRSISRLMNGIKKSFGGSLDDVLFVLTADHGVSPNVNYLQSHGIEAGYLKEKLLKDTVEESLNSKFGSLKNGNWLNALHSFNFYLNELALKERKVSHRDAEDQVKLTLLKFPGVAYVLTKSEYLAHSLPPGFYGRQIEKTFIPTQNGDVLLIPKAFFMEGKDNSTHMTGYSYDRSVPVIMRGRHFQAGVFATPAEVVDIAPTLSFLLGIVPPPHNEGRVLHEAFTTFQSNGRPLKQSKEN